MISIVVPTFNEKGNINPLLERIDKALPGIDYEVIFVDDSTDDKNLLKGGIDVDENMEKKNWGR